MAILRKTELKKHLIEFDDRCEQFRHALIGEKPNPNVWEQYSFSPEDFKRDFVEIDAGLIEYAYYDLTVSLKKLKAIKQLSSRRLGATK